MHFASYLAHQGMFVDRLPQAILGDHGFQQGRLVTGLLKLAVRSVGQHSFASRLSE